MLSNLHERAMAQAAEARIRLAKIVAAAVVVAWFVAIIYGVIFL